MTAARRVTFEDVRRIALRFRVPATDEKIYAWSPFGYAHEIGHLLVSTAWQRARPQYGFTAGFDHAGRSAQVNEVAATIIHAWIAVPCIRARTRRRQLWRDLRRGVAPYMRSGESDLDLTDWWHKPAVWRAARRLIAQRGVTPAAVQTVRGLTALCQHAMQS